MLALVLACRMPSTRVRLDNAPHPPVIPPKAGLSPTQHPPQEIPAFAGMTVCLWRRPAPADRAVTPRLAGSPPRAASGTGAISTRYRQETGAIPAGGLPW
jgi:hypothetical protein